MSLPPAGSIFVQTGRTGDLLNIFPMFKAIGGGSIVCNPEYLPLFESVSYANPIPWAGDIQDFRGAAKMVENLGHPVFISQRFGSPDFAQKPLSDSYAKDEWLAAGVPLAHGFGTLDIDVRYRNAERVLVNTWRNSSKPLVLLNLSGISSPYPYADELRQQIMTRWSDQYEIIDLAKVRTHRFCDLLALYDVATLLITTDTATLHLAKASTVPVVALTQRGWLATPAHPNWVHHQYYDRTDFGGIDAVLSGAKLPTHGIMPSETLEVWFVIPTANPERCTETFRQWRAMGYRTAALVDGTSPAPGNADVVLRVGVYEGYAKSVNMLAHTLRDADIVVTGGDDVYPDPIRHAQDIAHEFINHFNGTLGIMQPTGPDGCLATGEDANAISPWMGREWIRRGYKGQGPLCSDYFHYYVDPDLTTVGRKLGLYWNNPAVTQRHDNWHFRPVVEAPKHLSKALARNDMDGRTFALRTAAGFPDSELLP